MRSIALQNINPLKSLVLGLMGIFLVACGGDPTPSSSTSSSLVPSSSSQSSNAPESSSSVASSSAVISSSSASTVNTDACPYKTGLGVGAGGYHYACAALQSGKAVCIDTNGSQHDVTLNGSPATDIVAVTNGAYGGELCAVTEDGNIYCGRDGDLTSMPYSGGGVNMISTNNNGGDFCAMGEGSTLVCGNASGSSVKQLPEALSQLQCFRNGCCGVTVSGGMWCDADKDRALSRTQQNGKNLVVVSGGDEATCGVFADGSTQCWGASWNGQIGVGDNNGAPKPGRTPINISGKVVSTALGQHFSCWLTAEGRVYCSGVGTANGAGGDSETPVLINDGNGQPLTQMIDITAGRGFACATNRSGELYCWGALAGGKTAKKFNLGGDQVIVPSECR